MTHDTVLHDALDRVIGPGPDGPDLAQLIHHGRRGVRRRRAGIASAALAVVAVAGGGAALATGGVGTSSSGPEPAATASSTPESAIDETLHGREQAWEALRRQSDAAAASGLRIGGDGRLDVPPGAEVVRRVDNPLGLTPPNSSDAVVVRDDGDVTWYLVRSHDGRGSRSHSRVAMGRPGDAASFDAWVAEQGGS